MADKKDRDELIQMTHDGKTFSQVPRGSFEDVWQAKGWKEAKPEDVAKSETEVALAEANVKP